MSPNRTQLVVAVAVNLAVGQLVASWLGFPRWAGTVAASGAMVAASRPAQLSPPVRQVLQVAVLPGAVAAELVEPNHVIAEECSCANNQSR